MSPIWFELKDSPLSIIMSQISSFSEMTGTGLNSSMQGQLYMHSGHCPLIRDPEVCNGWVVEVINFCFES